MHTLNVSETHLNTQKMSCPREVEKWIDEKERQRKMNRAIADYVSEPSSLSRDNDHVPTPATHSILTLLKAGEAVCQTLSVPKLDLTLKTLCQTLFVSKTASETLFFPAFKVFGLRDEVAELRRDLRAWVHADGPDVAAAAWRVSRCAPPVV